MPAHKALIADTRLEPRELPLLFVRRQLFYRRLKNIAQPPPLLNEKIAAKRIPIMLDHNIITTPRPKRTNRMLTRHDIRQDAVKRTDAYLLRPILRPPVEYPAQKIAVLLGRYTEPRNLARSRLPLHALNKLKVFNLKLFEKIKNLVRRPNVHGTYKHQNIKLDLVLSATLDPRHHLIECPLTGKRTPIGIVIFLRPVAAYPHQKLILSQKPAPLFIQQYPVRLQRIGYHLAGRTIFLLQLDNLFIKPQPHQRRLTTLPRKAAHIKSQPDIAIDEFIEHLIAHAVLTFAEQLRFARIKTVPARNITIRPGRLYQKCKWTHSTTKQYKINPLQKNL
jgi:hypothetical protein